VNAGHAVGAVAVAEHDLAEQEVLLELCPFLRGRGPHLPERSQGAAPVDEELVRRDHLIGEDGGVAAGGAWGTPTSASAPSWGGCSG
jgi:hypothetical protein